MGNEVEAHLAKIGEPHRSTLLALRSMLLKQLPHATEALKYGMPCVLVEGKGVAGYDAFRHHCSYFPMSGGVLERVDGIPEGWATSKGTLQFPVDRPPPAALVRALVRARLDEIGEVHNGTRYEFYDDGAVKAVGRMKDGQLHGAWRWFRKDGTLLRTGQFRLGEQTGTWETFDRNGRLVTSKKV